MVTLPLIHLSGEVARVVSLSELFAVNFSAEYEALIDDSKSVEQQLTPLWHSRGYFQPPARLTTFHWETVGGYNTTPCFQDKEVPIGASVFKLVDAIVLPSHNYLVYKGGIVAEKFGKSSDVYLEFLTRYSKFFQFDTTANCFSVVQTYSKENKDPLDSIDFEARGLKAVLISNHLHDRVYNHWFYNNLYSLFLLKESFDSHSLALIFTYQPTIWQIQTIQYYFGSRAKIIVTTKPTRFKFIYFSSFSSNAFLDGSYLSFLYDKARLKYSALPFEKLYISRNDSKNRRVINETDLHKVLLSRGFYPIKLSDFCFEDQVNLIGSARDIIFIEGSSGMNLLHASNTCKVTIISFKGPDPWKDILANFGLFDVERFVADLVPNNDQFDIVVDVDKFTHFIDLRH